MPEVSQTTYVLSGPAHSEPVLIACRTNSIGGWHTSYVSFITLTFARVLLSRCHWPVVFVDVPEGHEPGLGAVDRVQQGAGALLGGRGVGPAPLGKGQRPVAGPVG